MQHDMCRICLKVNENLTELQNNATLLNKIETISSIQLHFNDYYPSNICDECTDTINKFYDFREIIINNNTNLKQQEMSFQHIILKQPEELDLCEIEIKDESESDENIRIKSDDNQRTNQPKTKSRQRYKKILIECEDCGKILPSMLAYKNHRRTEHMAPGVCNICGVVMRADNLRRHINIHLENPIECKICGKILKNSESLRSHLLLHKGDTFRCELCGRNLKQKSEYNRHMKTHTNPEFRKVVCSVCGKKVRDIKRHRQSHTGERPVKCEFCGKGFSTNYALKVHIRMHTDEKPFRCEYCSLAFRQKVSLISHCKSKHNSTQ